MNWFERHLNWSLFLGLLYIPGNVSFTIGLLASIVIFPVAFIKVGGGFSLLALAAVLAEFVAMVQQAETILLVISLIVTCLLIILFTVWFLDRKGRSKSFVLLFIISWAIGLFGLLNEGNFIGGILILASILGNILSFIVLLLLGNERMALETELLAQRLDTERFGEYDNVPPKEPEYRDIWDGKVVTEKAPAQSPAETRAEAKVTEKAVSQERLKMPILLDDAGAVIRCFYHPDAEAVNSCSRCGQHVCSECNYVTGTHPICRNCWDKRAESPILAVPAKKQESPKLGKSENREAEQNEWLREFMLLYEQALPFISAVVKKGADGLPASPLDLMEGLKLRPMLEHAKKLSEPKDKELNEAKNEFEQVLLSCIKVAEAAADFVGGGGQTISSGADFTRVADGIEAARGLMEGLSRRLAPFAQPQKY